MNEQKETIEYFEEIYSAWEKIRENDKGIEKVILDKFHNSSRYKDARKDKTNGPIIAIEENVIKMEHAFLRIYGLCLLMPQIFSESSDKDTQNRYSSHPIKKRSERNTE